MYFRKNSSGIITAQTDEGNRLDGLIHLLSQKEADLYNMDTMLYILRDQCLCADKVKDNPQRIIDGSIIVKVSEMFPFDLAIKIHPDGFQSAKAIYENIDHLELLSDYEFTSRIILTCNLPNSHHKKGLRLVAYEHTDKLQVKKYPNEGIEAAKAQIFYGMRDIGFDISRATTNDYLFYIDEGIIKAKLSDFNMISII
jgi:hypothetical protein